MVHLWGLMVPGAMPILQKIGEYVWWLSIAGYAVLFFHLRRQGLQRTYRFFTVYVAASVISALVLYGVVRLAKLLTGDTSQRFSDWCTGGPGY